MGHCNRRAAPFPTYSDFFQISLLLFSVAFLLSELSLLSREGASLLWQSRCSLQLLLALLSLTVGALHFARIWLAEVRLQHYWDHRQAFTSFYEVAVLAQMEVNLSALLLTIAMLKVGECMETCVARWGHIYKNPRLPFPNASASASPPLCLHSCLSNWLKLLIKNLTHLPLNLPRELSYWLSRTCYLAPLAFAKCPLLQSPSGCHA